MDWYSKIFNSFILILYDQGSFRCGGCKPGYIGDQRSGCRPERMCANGQPSPCHEKAECIVHRDGTLECRVKQPHMLKLTNKNVLLIAARAPKGCWASDAFFPVSVVSDGLETATSAVLIRTSMVSLMRNSAVLSWTATKLVSSKSYTKNTTRNVKYLFELKFFLKYQIWQWRGVLSVFLMRVKFTKKYRWIVSSLGQLSHCTQLRSRGCWRGWNWRWLWWGCRWGWDPEHTGLGVGHTRVHLFHLFSSFLLINTRNFSPTG